MPDILRVTTPLINKNQAVPPSQGSQSITPFDIQDISKVIKSHNQSDINSQNNGLIDTKEGPNLLMNLLKDPAVATTYLKNIFLLEEIFKLLPANNKTITQEIQQIFEELIIDPDQVKSELIKQEQGATMFKGPFFDFLRNLSETYKDVPEMQYQIATLIKSLNNLLSKNNILDAIANGLNYLKESMSVSKEITEQIDQILEEIRQNGNSKNFPLLKEKIQNLLEKVEDSILFSSKQKKVISIITYNMSRYNDNMDYFNEASYRLRQMMTTEQRITYVTLLEQLINELDQANSKNQNNQQKVDQDQKTDQNQKADQNQKTDQNKNLGIYTKKIGQNPYNYQNIRQPEDQTQNSKIMQALTKLIGIHVDSKNTSQTDAAKIDKMLYSLLSSPCNFTPLLHFIIPVIHENIRAFAEIWINPESDEKDMPEGVKEGKHFLLVIDIDNMGRFEAEIYAYENTVDFHLYCPPGYKQKFEPLMKTLPKTLKGMAYQIGKTKIYTLEKQRSLMDVFKSLPYKRVGVDVKI